VAKRTQAAKRYRQSLKKKARNFAYRSRLRSFLKSARTAISQNAEDKAEQVQQACRELDRMASKGIIHGNNASRRKSRLIRSLTAKPVEATAVKDSPVATESEQVENNTA
jgi:small subunit ribosomal protein S20